MKPVTALIVEDEPSGIENLRFKLQEYCPEVSILAECPSGKDAIRQIRRHLPDLIFLDIHLGDMTGFEVLQAVQQLKFEVIFTTSSDDYGIKAVKSQALDYLLKPIDIDELIEAVAKMQLKLREKEQPPAPSRSNRLSFPISTGSQFIDVEDIVYAMAEDNVATLTLLDKSKVKLTKPLGWVGEQLEDRAFYRVHHSYLINFNHIKEYVRNDGGYVIMCDNKLISVARRRKEDFLLQLEKWERGD